jgi:hypothetical protein
MEMINNNNDDIDGEGDGTDGAQEKSPRRLGSGIRISIPGSRDLRELEYVFTVHPGCLRVCDLFWLQDTTCTLHTACTMAMSKGGTWQA